MKILIIGERENFEEFKLKFGEEHTYSFVSHPESVHNQLSQQEFIIDFLIEEQPENYDLYKNVSQIPVFLNTVKTSLTELSYINGRADNCFGFNGLPTMVNRLQLEVTCLPGTSATILKGHLSALSTDYLIVKDRVGMVTPRVLCMIINEAYYTVQEGTASRSDIDLGMKLGTNYPLGPFEWTEKMGVANVYETLEAIYDDTKDERYKICSLLKEEYLLSQSTLP